MLSSGSWIRSYNWNSTTWLGALSTPSGYIAMGAIPPSAPGAIRIDTDSYSGVAITAGRSGSGVITLGSSAALGTYINTLGNLDLWLCTNSTARWTVGYTAATSVLKAQQVTAQIIGGATNGLAIRNSANTRDNFRVYDSGGSIIGADGGGYSWSLSSTAANGEIADGWQLQATAAAHPNLNLIPEGSTGGKVVIAYKENTGNTWKSALEVASIASGFGTLSLMKSGGQVSIGNSSLASAMLYINATAGNGYTSITQYGVCVETTFSSSATTAGTAGYFRVASAAAAFTMVSGYALRADAPTIGAGSAITNLYGLNVSNQGAAGVTNAYGVYITAQSGAATTNIGLYNAGTTQLVGNVGVGIVPSVDIGLRLNLTLATSPSQYGITSQPTFSSSATSAGFGIYVAPTTAASAFTMTNLYGIRIDNVTKGAGSTITNHYQLYIESPTQGGTSNYAIYITGGQIRNLGDYNGSGYILSTSATAGIGYATGAGSTVTQATSKATAFTLSKVCGKITFAGDALAANTNVSSTWTNTAIAAGDVVVANHVSGGTLGAYAITFTPGAGTCTVTLRNITGGSLTEAPVFQFAIIKAVQA